MRTAIKSLILAALLTPLAFAQGLDGKQITVKGGATDSLSAPVTVAYDGAAPKTSIEVVGKDGKAFPATVRNGELVFVPDVVPAGADQVYTVKVLKEAKPPRVEIKQESQEKVLEVRIDGKLFTAYHYNIDEPVNFDAAKAAYPDLTEDEFKRLDTNKDGAWTPSDEVGIDEKDAGKMAKLCNRKPFLWPVNSEGEASVTRNWPMGESEGKTDHLHQKSLWTAHGDINGASFWEESYEKSGYQMVEKVEFGSGDAYGWIVSTDVWQDKTHKPVIAESREYRFYAAPDAARIFDLAVTFKAAYGDATFGDTKEKGGSGAITTGAGAHGETEAWGKPAPWCDYTGTISGVGVRGITFFDHPSNLRYPARWHVRNYGLMGANYFGLHHFEPDLKQDGSWTLKNGESQVFKYRTLVHTGSVDEAKVGDRYTAYATPLQAAWK
jgi:hypothetical protein